MISFLRKIRYDLIDKNKSEKYFKYAIGEIFLVVIGILIALQVSNWNKSRIEANNLHSYYEKLVEELVQKILVINMTIKKTNNLGLMQKRVLEILNGKNRDDIPELIKVIGSVPTAWSIQVSAELFDEFMMRGLLSKVKDDRLKQALRNLKDVMAGSKIHDIYIDTQYTNLIEPYFAKNINYSKIALPKYKAALVQGGSDTDFESLFNSMELWNIATLKLETTDAALSILKNIDKALQELVSVLKDNIKNN
jgi:hypothetical protein